MRAKRIAVRRNKLKGKVESQRVSDTDEERTSASADEGGKDEELTLCCSDPARLFTRWRLSYSYT
jgi:hypothetical protein